MAYAKSGRAEEGRGKKNPQTRALDGPGSNSSSSRVRAMACGFTASTAPADGAISDQLETEPWLLMTLCAHRATVAFRPVEESSFPSSFPPVVYLSAGEDETSGIA